MTDYFFYTKEREEDNECHLNDEYENDEYANM